MTELRWRAVRDQLAAQDVPDPTLGALDEALDQPPPVGRTGRLLVAAGDEVLVDEYLPAPPAQPMVRVSPLPYLLPLADWNRRGVPHVVVTVDRTGADLRAVDGDGTTRDEDVTGRDHPVHKVRGGGMAHLNMQQHTDETVRRNLAEVAQEAARLVRDVDARAVADATVWTGTGPNMVAVDRDELHRVGVSERLHVPADEALPAAALAVGADILAASGDEPSLELRNGGRRSAPAHLTLSGTQP